MYTRIIEADKKSMKLHPIAFNSFRVSSEVIITGILDHK